MNNTTAFNPSSQLYGSDDVSTFNWQASEMKAAHQAVAIASWWGINDSNGVDANFAKIMSYMNPATGADPSNPYPNLRWAVYYEKEGYGNPSVSEIETDLAYIKQNYASQPGYLWINGKPVVFVYNANDGSSSTYWSGDVSRWTQVRQDTGFYVNMKIDPVVYGGFSPTVMDSWHEYAPADRSDSYGSYYYMASPGFWTEQNSPRLARDPKAFNNTVRSMARARVTWKLTETWNEWIEGTAVEPGIDANWTYDEAANPVATQADKGFGLTSSSNCTLSSCSSTSWVNTLGANLPPPG